MDKRLETIMDDTKGKHRGTKAIRENIIKI
jgi:hypothetical protein